MNKKEIFATLLLIIIIIILGIALVCVSVGNNYNILSDEELYNVSNNAYIQGALSISETGNVPYISNGTIQITTIQEICNLNTKQEVK